MVRGIRKIRTSNACYISLAHMVFMIYGLHLTIEDICGERYPFSVYEVSLVALYYLGNFLMILFLFVGLQKGKSVLCVPWLSITLGIIITANYVWLRSLLTLGINIFNLLVNFIVVGAMWLAWFSVLKEYGKIRKKKLLYWTNT